MSSRSQSPTILILLVLLVGAAVAFWLINREPEKPPENEFVKPQTDFAGTAIFQECAAESGLKFHMNFLTKEQGETFKVNLYDHGCGVAVGDYDGDGYDDIYFTNQLGTNALYRNRGDGTFEDKTEEAGVALGDRICVGATFIDYDNDGRQDLFVTSTRGGNVLFHNEGKGADGKVRYRDVTKKAGLELIGHCQCAHFIDLDNDGLLDLIVTQTAEWTNALVEPKHQYFAGKGTYPETAGSKKEFNVLYRNKGDGAFAIVKESGLEGLGWAADVAVLDYDGDNLQDVLITNMFGRSQLYRNLGGLKFKEVTKEVLGKTPWGGVGCHAFDFNNDGRLDLYIVDMHSDMWITNPEDQSVLKYETVKFPYLGIPYEKIDPRYAPMAESLKGFAALVQIKPDEVVFGNAFFKNLGDGKFVEISDKANLENFWPWGIACGDFDHNGLVDVFIPSGMGYPFFYLPNYLMMNQGNETFANRAKELGIEPPTGGIYQPQKIADKMATRSSRSAAIADFNGDGRLDIIVNNFNDHPYYYKNIGKAGHYLAFRLIGTKSNRDAIGAVVRLYAGKEIMTRQVNSMTGYLAQSSKIVHFGLKDDAKIDKVEITWPNGNRQNIPAPQLDAVHTVREPKD